MICTQIKSAIIFSLVYYYYHHKRHLLISFNPKQDKSLEYHQERRLDSLGAYRLKQFIQQIHFPSPYLYLKDTRWWRWTPTSLDYGVCSCPLTTMSAPSPGQSTRRRHYSLQGSSFTTSLHWLCWRLYSCSIWGHDNRRQNIEPLCQSEARWWREQPANTENQGNVIKLERNVYVVSAFSNSNYWINITYCSSSSDTSARFNIRVKSELTSLSRIFNKSNPCIGYVDISLGDLLEICSGGEGESPNQSCFKSYSTWNSLVKLDLHPSGGSPGPSRGTGVIYLRLERIVEGAEVQAEADTADVPATQVGMKTSSIGNKAHSTLPITDSYLPHILCSRTQPQSTER